MSDAPSGSTQKRQPLRARHIFYLILGAIGAAYLSAPQLWAPWVYFTGGPFHAVPWWAGAGSFTGPNGTYQVYLSLSPMNTGAHPPPFTAMNGEGHLCTPSGERWNLYIDGDMDLHLPLNTLGKSIEISSFPRSKPGSFSGMKAAGAPEVRLHGVWAPGRIDSKGLLQYEAAAPGHPAAPKPSPITVTLQQASYWWPPSCRTH